MVADASAQRDAIVRALEASPSSLVCIVGPTATGKTDLAVSVAERVGGEIVSADSVQVYRGFDVGSGKPSADERARAPHHLIDIADPLDLYDAATWAATADTCIDALRARGAIPIVCGGTFFWVRALVLGLLEAPRANEEVRARHRALAEAEGRPALHACLAAVDPEAAARLHPNDVVRVSRALEVFELTAKKMSTWQAEHGFRKTRRPALLFARKHEADGLTARIRERAARWLASGWLGEVEELRARGFGAARAMSSVGYREVNAHLEGALAEPELLGAIVAATRQFARRQRTWLARADVTWL